MEIHILTKDGDLEWKLENTKLCENRGFITFDVNNIRKGVKKAVAVMLSNYRISFSEPDNEHLEREKELLLGIYKDRIYTKHWRHIGIALGMTQHYLNNVENKKPRSLQEKVCIVLGRWLKDNPSRSLRHVQSVWN
ncbi:uncharacterized protein LOC110450960 [Mizuhopecten yessoensis]|uniref:uncharacterized protein LOC110450960 n=1 Tax=Mizuhopecten yessoensis TaxID=6573 RepID=UPI000B45C219|nr:uncharacterized protein LOC110450960 [Mizuhopecten yessoensis]